MQPLIKESHSINSFYSILLIGFISGFVTACLGFPVWHHAAEGAQVIAGIVTYPSSSPYDLYYRHTWTLLHQIPALFLNTGFPEQFLCIFLSGLQGALAYCALGLGVLAFSQNKAAAILAPFFIHFTSLTDHSTVYPVSLMGTSTTYGTIGLSMTCLVFIFLSFGKNILAGFLAGLLPAVHAGFGLLSFLLIGLFFLISKQKPRLNFLVSLTAGLALTGISAYTHHLQGGVLLPNFPQETRELLLKFIEVWDSHRRAVSWQNSGAQCALITAAFSGILLRQSKNLDSNAKNLLSFIFGIGLLSALSVFISQIRIHQLPLPLVLAMPGRVSSLCAFFFPVLILGLFLQRTAHPILKMSAPLLFGILYLKRPDSWPSLAFASALIGVCFLIPHREISKKLEGALKITALGIVAYAALKTGLDIQKYSQIRHEALRDGENHSALKAASKSSGMLLSAPGMDILPLMTRRPVLLNGETLDFVLYAPRALTQVQGILKEIYGVDLLAPPTESGGYAVLPTEAGRTLWQNWNTDDWRRLRAKYGVTQLLVYQDWKINLPINEKDSFYALYDLPEN